MAENPEPWWIKAKIVRDAEKAEDERKRNWWKGQKIEQTRHPEILDPRTKYYTRLAILQHLPDPFINSDAPENPLLAGIAPQNKNEKERALHSLYETRLTPYHYVGTSEKNDEKQRNIGHKLHLNIGLDDVVVISDYLKQKGFCHKFLSGGEVTDGTIFTIYTGSKDLTDSLANKLSQDLKPYLKKPVRPDEVEYAPNIPGRFVGDRAEFMQYGIGIRGISILRDMAGQFAPWASKNDLDKKQILAFDASFNKLADKYGDYFYGSK